MASPRPAPPSSPLRDAAAPPARVEHAGQALLGDTAAAVDHLDPDVAVVGAATVQPDHLVRCRCAGRRSRPGWSDRPSQVVRRPEHRQPVVVGHPDVEDDAATASQGGRTRRRRRRSARSATPASSAGRAGPPAPGTARTGRRPGGTSGRRWRACARAPAARRAITPSSSPSASARRPGQRRPQVVRHEADQLASSVSRPPARDARISASAVGSRSRSATTQSELGRQLGRCRGPRPRSRGPVESAPHPAQHGAELGRAAPDPARVTTTAADTRPAATATISAISDDRRVVR